VSGTVTTSRTGSPTASVSGTHTARWYGYVTPVAILDAVTRRNVTFESLDWRRDYLISVYAGLGFTFVETVLLAPPGAASLFQTTAVAPPYIAPLAVEVTPNYVTYLMPSTSASGPSSAFFTIAAGALKRSDTTFNRPTSFGVNFGFVPDVTLTDGVETDLEGASASGGGAAAWFSARNASRPGLNASVVLRVTAAGLQLSSANISGWLEGGAFYNADEGTPDAARLVEVMARPACAHVYTTLPASVTVILVGSTAKSDVCCVPAK
jgi:hypothetical protein